MGLTFNLGRLSPSIFTDSSLNVGIGGSPSGSYKLEVTGTAKVSSTLLLGGALTGTSATLAVSVNNSNTGLDLTNNAGSGYGNSINFYQSTTKFGQIFVETSAANTSEMSFKTMVGSTLATRLFISATGAATFSSPVGANIAPVTNYGLSTKGLYGLWIQRNSVNDSGVEIYHDGSNTIINSTYQGTGTFGGMLLYTSGNPRIAITSGGNVGINCTPDTNSKLDVNGQAFVAHLAIYNNNGTPSLGTSPMLYSPASATLAISTGNTERMRITSGGDVLVGWTGGTFNDPAYNGVQGISLRGISGGTSIISSSTSTSMYVNRFGGGAIFASVYSPSVGTAGTTVGTISVSSTATSYNTTSDYRLKEDFKDFNGLEKIYAINVYNFKWKNSDERMDGIIAHELQEILPYAVLGEKDGQDMQGVDYSKIVPILIKGMQEQQAQIQNLQEQNQDLKSRLDKAGL